MQKAVIITGPGYDETELIYAYYRLIEEDIKVDLVTSNNKEVTSKHGGLSIQPTKKYEELNINDYIAVIIPGGNEAPDRVRQVPELVNFVKKIHEAGKVIAAICHGPWVLISAKITKGKKMNCYIGMKDDLINAGAQYTNEPAVVDKNIITSDHPRNVAKWMKATIKAIAQE